MHAMANSERAFAHASSNICDDGPLGVVYAEDGTAAEVTQYTL